MEVIVAKSAGFCFGVKRATKQAYDNAGNSNTYTFGPIIHNEEVVSDLEQKGVYAINSLEEAKEKHNNENNNKSTIIIRSHGASKYECDKLKEYGYTIVDATCPFVKKIHNIVEKDSLEGYQVIIVGDGNHPEVKGIMGWCQSEPVIINSAEEAVNFSNKNNRKISIVAQTTFNYNKFQEILDIFAKKEYDIVVRNTICNATEERQKEAREIASKVDAMIVIGGRNSSNTQKLFDICKNECENTYYIQTAKDLDLSRLAGMKCVGITAGASTPNNIIEEVQTNVREF